MKKSCVSYIALCKIGDLHTTVIAPIFKDTSLISFLILKKLAKITVHCDSNFKIQVALGSSLITYSSSLK